MHKVSFYRVAGALVLGRRQGIECEAVHQPVCHCWHGQERHLNHVLGEFGDLCYILEISAVKKQSCVLVLYIIYQFASKIIKMHADFIFFGF